MPLTHTLFTEVMHYLGVNETAPDLAFLHQLVDVYVRLVPWESASRIVRRSQITETQDCPRWPEIFWPQAMSEGTGGTCFESNYAFFELLTALGYQGYLTINNMGDTIGCHTAIVILLDGEKWLVDVGLPVFAPLRIDHSTTTEYSTPLMNYSVEPLGDDRYNIYRNPHPSSTAFTLIDRPIDEMAYRRATTADYGEGGLFLDRVVINKVIDDRIWRFGSGDQPLRMEHFIDATRIDTFLDTDTDIAAETLGQKFSMNTTLIRDALKCVTP